MYADSSAQRLENISVGMLVTIQIKRLEKTMNGIITDIFDKEPFNSDGIEVEIDNFHFGHVKKIIKNDEFITENQLREKIKNHEQKTFELKSSFKYDIKVSNITGNPTSAEYLKRKIVEECASFMNSEGGIICIGVDDEKNILGLENDFKLQTEYDPKKDKQIFIDTLRGEIKQALIDYLQDPIIFDLCYVEMKVIDGKDVCCIIVEKSPKSIFVKMKINYRLDGKDKKDKIWKCWIRADNGIREVPFDSFMTIWTNKNNKMLSTG